MSAPGQKKIGGEGGRSRIIRLKQNMGSNRPCSGDRSLGEAGGGDEPVGAGVGGGGGLPELLGGVGQPVGLGTGRKRCYERIDISIAATPATGQTMHQKNIQHQEYVKTVT